MKQIKGCLNSECTEYKKTKYKSADEYCVKCGSKLNFVCKHPKCFKQLPYDSRERFCAYHIEEKKDRRDRRAARTAKIGSGILTAASVAVGVVGAVAGAVNKTK